MLTTFIRTVIMYFFVVLTLRLLGKRQIGELEPSELVVTIVISELASLPIQDSSQPLINILVTIFLLVILEVIISFSAYRSLKARKVFFGTPSVFFEKGKINQKEMDKQRFNINDLMECIRNTGATSLSEVEFVIMETNGNVSVIPSGNSRPVTPLDIGKQVDSPELSYVIIDNGNVNPNNLFRLGFNEDWLSKELEKNHIKSPSNVFCMTATAMGDVVIIPRVDERKM